MVQEFNVLKCFSCQTYQVQQVKKSNKWSCKMCGEKQSVVKAFLRGEAVDCRRLVQTLNAQRGDNIHKLDDTAWSLWEQKTQGQPDDAEKQLQHDQPLVSRWKKYLPHPEEGKAEEEQEEEDELDWGGDVNKKHCHGNNVRKRKRRGWNNEEENCFSHQDKKQSRVNPNPSRPCHSKPNHTASDQSRTKETKPNLSRSHQTRITQTRPNQTSATAPSRWSRFLDPVRPCLEGGGSGVKECSLPYDWLKSSASLPAAEEWSNRKTESSHTTTALLGTDASWQHPSQLIGALFDTGDDFDLFDA